MVIFSTLSLRRTYWTNKDLSLIHIWKFQRLYFLRKNTDGSISFSNSPRQNYLTSINVLSDKPALYLSLIHIWPIIIYLLISGNP